MMSIYFNYNGKLYQEHKTIITADSRALRYGDGLFETIRVSNNKIKLKEFHFDRLFAGMKILQFHIPIGFHQRMLEEGILNLCRKNHFHKEVRVRLMVFRGEGGLYDPENHIPNYIIQVWEIAADHFNENGLQIDIFQDIRKSNDILGNLKTNNYLPYILAALFVKKRNGNDALLLNVDGNVCDSTNANVFVINGNNIITPPLSAGCVSGVMRRWLIDQIPSCGYNIIEKELTVEELEKGESVFLTNAIHMIRWVKNCGSRQYSKMNVLKLYNVLARK